MASLNALIATETQSSLTDSKSNFIRIGHQIIAKDKIANISIDLETEARVELKIYFISTDRYIVLILSKKKFKELEDNLAGK